MLSIIKTALVTITLSFISGVLLDHYKNYAPRLVCNIGRGRVLKTNNKRIKVYFLTIRNISKKTIHNLNVNINAICDSLNINDAKITKGLKFDITNEDNVYNVAIPFLSKYDEFTVKVLLEDTPGRKSKPVVNLRSPENFKRIDFFESKYEDITGTRGKRNTNILDKYLFSNKKVLISIAGVLLVAFIGILSADYYIKNVKSNDTKYEENDDENTSNDTSNTLYKDTRTTTNYSDQSSSNKNKDYSNNEDVSGKSNSQESNTPSKPDNNTNEATKDDSIESNKDTGNSSNSNTTDGVLENNETPTSDDSGTTSIENNTNGTSNNNSGENNSDTKEIPVNESTNTP